jgi:hypothetical protein
MTQTTAKVDLTGLDGTLIRAGEIVIEGIPSPVNSAVMIVRQAKEWAGWADMQTDNVSSTRDYIWVKVVGSPLTLTITIPEPAF